MNKIEILALAISHLNGGFEPGTKAFQLCNPGLLKTYRPEKKVDGENYRVFTSIMGGFKALTAELQAKASGKNPALTPESPLQELLVRRGFKTPAAMRPIILFLRKAFATDDIDTHTPLGFFAETPAAPEK